MQYQLAQLRIVNRIIDDYENALSPEQFKTQLTKHREWLYDYCKSYEQAEFEARLEKRKKELEEA